jgi:hypothetical protein
MPLPGPRRRRVYNSSRPPMFCLARMLVVPVLAGFLLLPLGVSAQTRRAAPRKPARHTAVPKAEQPQPPPAPPLTPEQMPPVPPQVTYQNGQLTIVAQNSSLRDILTAVGVQTGASLEMPPGAGDERAVVRLGPAAPRDVIAALLQGSNFDYILLGSPGNPNALRRIILSPRGNAPAGPPGMGTGVMGGSSPGNPPGQPPRPFVQSMPPEQVEEPEGEEAPEPVPPPNQVPEEQARPSLPTPQVPGPSQVKTPQQLLQELQRMQQQRPQKPVPPE